MKWITATAVLSLCIGCIIIGRWTKECKWSDAPAINNSKIKGIRMKTDQYNIVLGNIIYDVDAENGICIEDEGEMSLNKFLDAIEWVESRGDANAIGANGEIGAYQICKDYVDDVNKIFMEKFGCVAFDYSDRYNRKKSRDMVVLYVGYYATFVPQIENSYEPYARIHNGGPDGWKKECTKPYWEKVKARLAGMR